MKYALYRHFDKNNSLLYVGISLSFLQRTTVHKTRSHWFNSVVNVTIERFKSRQESIIAETIAIDKEKPKYNIFKNRRNIKCKNKGNNISNIKEIVHQDTAAKILKISQNYLWRMNKIGVGPDFYKVGHFTLYSKKDLKKYIKSVNK